MKASEILIAARALIDTPEKWVKGRKYGCWCARDAIIAVAPDEPRSTNSALATLKRAIGRPGIVSWNDAPERTHAEVMAAFDRAIAAEQAKELQ